MSAGRRRNRLGADVAYVGDDFVAGIFNTPLKTAAALCGFFAGTDFIFVQVI